MQREEAIIGRSEDSDIQIDDPTISRYHAKVSVKYFIHDVGSTNGIWKEGKRFKQTTIDPGEEVFLGKGEKYQLRLETGPAPPDPDPGGVVQPRGKEAEKDSAKDAKEKEARIKKMKGQLDRLKEQVKRMKADLEKSKAAGLGMEKAFKDLKEENRFLREALYPDGSYPEREEPSLEAEPGAMEMPETPETAPEPVVDVKEGMEEGAEEEMEAPVPQDLDFAEEDVEYPDEASATDEGFQRRFSFSERPALIKNSFFAGVFGV